MYWRPNPKCKRCIQIILANFIDSTNSGLLLVAILHRKIYFFLSKVRKIEAWAFKELSKILCGSDKITNTLKFVMNFSRTLAAHSFKIIFTLKGCSRAYIKKHQWIRMVSEALASEKCIHIFQ